MLSNIFLLNDDFQISKEYFGECINALIEFHKKIEPGIICPGGAASHCAENLSDKLFHSLSFFDWTPFMTKEGVDGLNLDLPKKGNEYALEAIAPFVRSGSIIEFIDEEGNALKYEFLNGCFNKFHGKISYAKKT